MGTKNTIRRRKLLITIVSISSLLVLLGGFIYERRTVDTPNSTETVSNFDECIAGGNPVQESFPPRCVTNDGQTFTQTSDTTGSTTTNPSASEDPAITNLGSSSPTIQKGSDVASLQKSTYPSSFISYLNQKVSANQPDSNNCVNSYSISRVSSINIAGGVQTVDASTKKPSNSCGGGASVVWYLQDGKWNEIGLQAQPDCSQLDGTTIYSEFIATCFDPNAPNQEAKNPNGSIKDAN